MAKKNSYYLFKLDTAEFSRQVDEHDTLPIKQTARSIAALTMVGLQVLSLGIVVVLNLFVANFPISWGDVLLGLIVYAPLIYFTYKGHLWAIVLLGLWYTVDKFAIMASPSFTGHVNIGAIAFWVIGISPLWIAFQVERAYRKKKSAKTA